MRVYIWLVLCLLTFAACESVSKYPIDAPGSASDSRFSGIWKFREDTNSKNFYEVAYSTYNHQYHVKFWDRGGTNPTYEANVYFTKIGDATFINMPYYNPANSVTGKDYNYFFFLKILYVNKDFSEMTTATIHDSTLIKLESSAEVKAHISRHLEDPRFYYDTAHLYKVK